MYTYSARVNRVLDADTFEADVDLGFRVHAKFTFRVLNYDAPETYRPTNTDELRAGEAAKVRARGFLLGAIVIIRSHMDKSFDRWLADVALPDGRDYATVMKARGHIKKEEWK